MKLHMGMNLQGLVISIGILGQDETGGWLITPVRDMLFQFTQLYADAESWVVVYTGKGTPQVTRLPTTLETAYSFHWGRETVIFTDPRIVPVVYRLGGIEFPEPPRPQQQQQLPGLSAASLNWQPVKQK